MRKTAKVTKEQNDQELKRLYRKLDSLRDAIYKLPKVKLDIPRWMGYKRYYILRDDIAKRKDAKDFLEILNLLNTTVFSKTKEGFSRYDFDEPRLFCSKQRIKSLSEKSYNALKEHYKKYFVRVTKWDKRLKYFRYEFIHDYYFVYKIKHHYITEVPMLNKEMESELQKIENKIYVNHWMPKIHKLMGWRWNYRDDYNEKKIRLVDLIIKNEIVDYVNGKDI